jgi:hypothetical protein
LAKTGDYAQNQLTIPSETLADTGLSAVLPILRRGEAVTVRKKRIKPNYHRRVLRIPDLDHCKLAVLNSLGSPASRRVYEYAIDQFTAWYCSEPRLAFNRIVVVRYRLHMESRGLAANTINQQPAAVRRLAHEAADSGLLSPELAAVISSSGSSLVIERSVRTSDCGPLFLLAATSADEPVGRGKRPCTPGYCRS